MDWLVTTDWLHRHLDDRSVVILDCSWHLPEKGTFAGDDFLAGHIPGARFFDLNTVSDPDSPYANMLPTAAHFAEQVGALGVGSDSHVVVYDSGYVSARVWWMFRVFGHDRVSILDGGWRKWVAEGRPVETGPAAAPALGTFSACLVHGWVIGLEEMRVRLDAGDTPIVDARTAAKFDGVEASGYPGVPSGHMPGSVNTPWARFFDADNNHVFVSPAQAEAVFAEAGVDVSGPVITTCGSGVTAAILGFMIERGGNRGWRLYDGSWHEWGQQPDTPKRTRPAE